MRTGITLLLIISLTTSSLVLIDIVSAQTTPSVPEFSLVLKGSYFIVHIRNQPPDNTDGNLYYGIRMKYHNATDWWEAYSNYSINSPYPSQVKDSDFTDLVPTIEGVFVITHVVDVQVEAIYGYVGGSSFVPDQHWITSSTSGWSPTQTIIIPPIPTPILNLSPNPTPSSIVTPIPTVVIVQSVPTWFYIVIVGLMVVIAVLLGALVLVLKRNQHNS